MVRAHPEITLIPLTCALTENRKVDGSDPSENYAKARNFKVVMEECLSAVCRTTKAEWKLVEGSHFK